MDAFAVIDVPRGGAENMALDQYLLDLAAEQQCVFLRVYRWSEPTLSLGYFQAYAERETHLPSRSIDVVRRATGGGAIVHHFDWTYCVVVPDSLKWNHLKTANTIGSNQALYDAFHDAVVGWLNQLGISADKWSTACQAQTRPSSKDFLGFNRRSCGDVVWNGKKILGSAQRRRPGALLQHGSLLLATSPCAPELEGLGAAPDGGTNFVLNHTSGGSSPSQASASDTQIRLELTSFYESLTAAVKELAGCQVHVAQQLSDCPVQWCWPRDTHFAESDWTRRR